MTLSICNVRHRPRSIDRRSLYERHCVRIVVLAVKQGELDAFRALMEEMVAHAQTKPGTIIYEWFVSDDGGTVHIYERYLDSAAALESSNDFGEHFAERFIAAVDVTGFSVYGNPNDAVREAHSGVGAQFLEPFGGFAR